MSIKRHMCQIFASNSTSVSESFNKRFLQFNPQELNIVALSNIILPYLSRLFYRSLAFLQNDMMGFRSIRISSELCDVICAKCRPIVIQWKCWTSVTVFASRYCSWKVQYDELEIRQLKRCVALLYNYLLLLLL